MRNQPRNPLCFAKLYGNMGLTKTYFGKKIIINTRNIHTLSLIDNGVIEAALCRIFEKYINVGDVVVDVGANIGFLSLLAGDLVGPNGSVISIEANPEVYKTLEENIIINGFTKRFFLHQLAVYDCATELTFTWNEHRDGSGRIVTPVQPGLAKKHCQVETKTLDAICADTKVDLIKIDTEGAEPYVLRGAKETIAKNPNIKVIFEWNSKHIKQRNQQPEEFVEEIFSQFSHVQLIKGKGVLVPISHSELMNMPHANILAYSQG